MPQSAGPAPVRLEIRAGEVAVCGSRLVRIRAMTADGLVGIEDLTTGEHSDVSLADLRSRPAAIVGTQIDVQLEAVRSSSDNLWQRATIREDALTALLEGTESLAVRAKEVATQHKISVRTLYRWLARYRDTAQTSALIAHVRGVRSGARRAALWLVLQVIWYIPSGVGRLALRLGDTPQDSFFGSQCHAGWAWLTERASAWPIRLPRLLQKKLAA